jgi:hypothetical protein
MVLPHCSTVMIPAAEDSRAPLVLLRIWGLGLQAIMTHPGH